MKKLKTPKIVPAAIKIGTEPLNSILGTNLVAKKIPKIPEIILKINLAVIIISSYQSLKKSQSLIKLLTSCLGLSKLKYALISALYHYLLKTENKGI